MVTIRLFDPAHLEQGNVVADFLKLLDVDNETLASLREVDANKSDPAELTAAQDWIRQRAFRDLNGFSEENRKLNRALRAAQNGLELGRQALKPNAAEAVLHANRTELFWLRSALGLAFDDIDYDALDASPGLDLKEAELTDLLEFDIEKRDLLIARTVRELCNAASPKQRPAAERALYNWRNFFRK